MVINLRSDGDKKKVDPQIFTHWEIAGKDERRVHVMIVLDPDYDCAGFEGPHRFKILQQLANLIEPTTTSIVPALNDAAPSAPGFGEPAKDAVV
eukprot:gene13760-9853_t